MIVLVTLAAFICAILAVKSWINYITEVELRKDAEAKYHSLLHYIKDKSADKKSKK